MKTCDAEGCDAQILDTYTYCFEHFKQQKKPGEHKPPQWHDDPTVDILMKMNYNLGHLVKQLEETNQHLSFLGSKK